jgi:dienelactone hydrolase
VRLLADSYARAGFTAYIPDTHQGDSLPISFLQTVEPPLPEREALSLTQKAASTAKVGATLGPWLVKHREGVTKPLIDDFITAIRNSPGAPKIGVIGFCWGGRYAILAAHSDAVDAAYACHPSMVAVPGDFEPIVKPLSLAVGEKDSLLGMKEVQQIKELLEKKDVPSEVKVYDDQVHGFALRGDWSSEKDKESMDGAEKQGIEWFNKYLA